MSPFKAKVIEIVKIVPYGKVVSYGQVALYAGVPRAARQVGWILNSLEDEISLPWWRVINNKGYISIKGNRHNDRSLQKKLLEQEGIIVQEDFTLDIEHYRFILSEKQARQLQLNDLYIEKILAKYV
jgi:methylated-DNA-protein-cysteine methyltransferase related protein